MIHSRESLLALHSMYHYHRDAPSKLRYPEPRLAFCWWLELTSTEENPVTKTESTPPPPYLGNLGQVISLQCQLLSGKGCGGEDERRWDMRKHLPTTWHTEHTWNIWWQSKSTHFVRIKLQNITLHISEKWPLVLLSNIILPPLSSPRIWWEWNCFLTWSLSYGFSWKLHYMVNRLFFLFLFSFFHFHQTKGK